MTETTEAQTSEEFPAWFHTMQIDTLEKNIARETSQREELVRWIARIDADNARDAAIIADHQAAIAKTVQS